MSKKKPSRIASLEQKNKELTYFVAGVKSRLDLVEKTLSEYIEFKKIGKNLINMLIKSLKRRKSSYKFSGEYKEVLHWRKTLQ